MAVAPGMPSGPTAGLAADTRSLDALRGVTARDPRTAAREAARQFESLFMHELLKSMRQATPPSGLLDNEGTKLGTDLLDQQLATSMAGLRGGLTDVIARQLERQMSLPPLDGAERLNGGVNPRPADGSAPATPATAPTTTSSAAPVPQRLSAASDFVSRHQGAAREIEKRTGIPATFMIAQAAHETGWGRREIRLSDGSSAHNLFGIKAGADWKGPVAEVTTTEFINGVARKVTARFRAYASAAESFADYAKLMTRSPRYQSVVADARTAQGFAQSLQRAGYATDPEYASKLERVINTTLRLQRSVA